MKIPRKQFLNIIFSAGLFFVSTVLEVDATRGIRLQLRASEQTTAPIVEEVQLYDSSYALVIGINDYTQGWPRLSNAIRDAELVTIELRKKGFEVTLKKNLNFIDLERTFREFFVYKGDAPHARLFAWFAGHGHTQNGEGYLIPADAPLPHAGAEFRIKALSMRRFGEYVRLARAKHAFAVFDSCFSGTIFTTQRSTPPAAVTRATTLPVRQFLSSGDESQQVSDDGMFRKLFTRALRGEERADANGDGYLTGSELGMFLTDRVTNLTVNRQTPRYGKLRDEDYDRGDFVFLLASSGAVVEKPEKTGTQAILSEESKVIGVRVLEDDRAVGSTKLQVWGIISSLPDHPILFSLFSIFVGALGAFFISSIIIPIAIVKELKKLKRMFSIISAACVFLISFISYLTWRSPHTFYYYFILLGIVVGSIIYILLYRSMHDFGSDSPTIM